MGGDNEGDRRQKREERRGEERGKGRGQTLFFSAELSFLSFSFIFHSFLSFSVF
jgi:hypothetical protein